MNTHKQIKTGYKFVINDSNRWLDLYNACFRVNYTLEATKSFEELEDKILPPMQLEFNITLQDDTELIWQNDGTDRRVVVRTFELWAPSLQFT